MKLNKKGFMLAEVVIVASVVATVLVTIYILLSRVSSNYETRNRYNDIDAMYVAMEINDILDNAKPDFIINNNASVNLINNSNLNSFINFYNNNAANNHAYLIRQVYYCPFVSELFAQIASDSDFNNYRDYLLDKLDFNDERIKYLVIVELEKDNGNKYYYSLKVKNNIDGGTTNEENG